MQLKYQFLTHPELTQKGLEATLPIPEKLSRFDFLEVSETPCYQLHGQLFASPLFECHIAGTMYREDIWQKLPSLKTGQILYLVREAENPYDGLAIRVETADGFHLGYVPRCRNREPAEWLDCGGQLQASLLSIRDSQRWLNIDIRVSKLTLC
ncbi:MAG: HIRAN domain-containing protein [Candidatus Sericytochromatia bacterium]